MVGIRTKQQNGHAGPLTVHSSRLHCKQSELCFPYMRTRLTGHSAAGLYSISVQSVHLYFGERRCRDSAFILPNLEHKNKVMEYRHYPISSQLQIDSLSRWWRNYRSWNRVTISTETTQITRSRSRPVVEECRGRPLFHVIPRKTCSIDTTFV